MAEQKESKLRTQWLETLQKFKTATKLTRVHEPGEYESELRNFIHRETQHISVRAARQAANSRIDEAQIQAAVVKQFEDRQAELKAGGGPGPSFVRSYQIMWDRHQKLIDERKQELWADRRDRLETLVFRILTTIGVAAVIFCAAWLSKVMEIPLPMIRMP